MELLMIITRNYQQTAQSIDYIKEPLRKGVKRERCHCCMMKPLCNEYVIM